MNLEDFVYIPPPDQEPIVDDKQYFFRNEWFFSERLIKSHLEYVKQVQLEYPEIICSCPMCEQYRAELAKKQTNIE